MFCHSFWKEGKRALLLLLTQIITCLYFAKNYFAKAEIKFKEPIKESFINIIILFFETTIFKQLLLNLQVQYQQDYDAAAAATAS